MMQEEFNILHSFCILKRDREKERKIDAFTQARRIFGIELRLKGNPYLKTRHVANSPRLKDLCL